MCAGAGAGGLVGAGAAAAFGAKEEVPKQPEEARTPATGPFTSAFSTNQSEALPGSKGPETEVVYSDKQSDIWSAVGKAAAGGLGVGAALGGVATAAVAAPAITAVAAGVWLLLNFVILSHVLCRIF
jgi:hypothetical protein